MIAHNKEAAVVLSDLATDRAQGLSQAEAVARKEQYGENKLREKKKKTTLQRFLDQFKDAMKLPKGHVYVAYRPLRMPISLLKGIGQTIAACDKANEPIYLQKFNKDELVVMNCTVYARLQNECKPCH